MVWGPSGDSENTRWRMREVDLSAYDGNPNVTISFELNHSDLIQYGGWYIDDVLIGNAANFEPLPRGADSFSLAGLTGNGLRLPASYDIYRLSVGDEADEDEWTLITPNGVNSNSFSDHGYAALENGVYKWAVVANFSSGESSIPRFSNPIRKEPNDISALAISGNNNPNLNAETTYTITIKNTGTRPQNAGAYTVKLMVDGDELASVNGPAISIGEEVAVPINWTPTQPGVYTLSGKVVHPQDSNPLNDECANIGMAVLGDVLLALQVGTGTATNAVNNSPTPYGTYSKNFRQHFLYTVPELSDLGASPGNIGGIAFYVTDVAESLPMKNFRIRMAHTDQNELVNSFETAIYTELYQRDYFLPTTGWNIHKFDTPFQWNGVENIIVEVVTGLYLGPYTQNSKVRYSTTTFNSSLRYASDSQIAETNATGTPSNKRSNTRFYLQTVETGSLSGTVTENGLPVKNMHISIEGTTFATYSNTNGAYNFPYLQPGSYTLHANKTGFEVQSHTVEIVAHQNTVQDFSVIGTPEFEIDDVVWDFGEVRLGQIAFKTFTITNPAGGNLIIQSIVPNGSPSFNFVNPPTLPMTLRTEESGSFTVSFSPGNTEPQQCIIAVTDNLGRLVHNITLSGIGTNNLTIGQGNMFARLPLDFYYKSSIYETIIKYSELQSFEGRIQGLKLHSYFESVLSETPIKIWMGPTNLNDLSSGWINSGDLELVFDGNITIPSGMGTIEIIFDEEYFYTDDSNLAIMFFRPMDTDYHSSGDLFFNQEGGTARSRYNMSDSSEYDHSNMSGGTVTELFPKLTFIMTPGRVGQLQGIVKDAAGNPLSGVEVNCSTITHPFTTSDSGIFYFSNLLPDTYQLSFSKYGFITQEATVEIEADETTEIEITLPTMPKVNVFGRILASDTQEGISGATIRLNGYANYQSTSDDEGYFGFDSDVYALGTYSYHISATGYVSSTGSIEVEDDNYDMQDLVLSEIPYAPTLMAAEISENYMSALLSWNAPDPDAFELIEGFEGQSFPPSGWDQHITNHGAPNNYGVLPTWCAFGTVENIFPPEGTRQAGLAWVAEHQDEWLYTPSFICPSDTYLRFETHLNMGSDGGDHYYVKISTNNGNSWTVLWDGSAQPVGTNNYSSPIIIDLSDYYGQDIQLAFHADDGPSQQGMWGNWFIDNIYIGNMNIRKDISLFAEAGQGYSERALVGYHIWRMRAGEEEDEDAWELLNTELINQTSYSDDSWQGLPYGQYRWAVKAIYDAEIVSTPAISNILVKQNINGTVMGFVRNASTSTGIAGVTISAGEYSTNTSATGFYSLNLPPGVYTVTTSHSEYFEASVDDVQIIPEENTTLNFNLEPTSNEDLLDLSITRLNGNYPNPFNPHTTISYQLKEAAQVRLDIYNMKGQLVRTLVNTDQPSGRYEVMFDAKDAKGNKIGSGIYFYRLKAGDYQMSRKMLLME